MEDVKRQKLKSIVRAMALDMCARPDSVSDYQMYGLQLLCEELHVTKPTVERLKEILQVEQTRQRLTGGQNLRIAEVYDIAIEAGR